MVGFWQPARCYTSIIFPLYESSLGNRAEPVSKAYRTLAGLHEFLLAACGGSGGCANRAAVPSYQFRPPPSNQTEEQARFECTRLVRAGTISDAELLRLREQPLSWSAVLGFMHDRRADNALRALELLARHHTFT